MSPPLLDRYASLRDRLAWMPLSRVPTAVEPMTAIADWLGRKDVWMKRDDLISPLYGGNKIRRYEYVLAEAKKLGRTRIVTVGGLASTQVMATALFGKEQGFAVSAVFFDQPHTKFMREALLVDAAAGCRMIYGGGYVRTAWKAWREYHREPGAYFIPPGAANPIANLGYVDAMFELAAQVDRGEMPRPDVIVLPTGSSGTLAALAIGAKLLGWPTQIVGVRITLPIGSNRFTIGRIAAATWSFLRKQAAELKGATLGPINFDLVRDVLGKGYGYPTEAAVAALPYVKALLGCEGEVTYSAKGLVGLKQIAQAKEHERSTILYWNTLSSRRPDVSNVDPRAVLPNEFHRFFDGPLAV